VGSSTAASAAELKRAQWDTVSPIANISGLSKAVRIIETASASFVSARKKRL
jgi:hypothetical protein